MVSRKHQITIFEIIDPQDSHKNTLTVDHFDLETRNPRFVYWLLAEGKEIGEEYRIYEFIIWMNRNVCNFKKTNGFTENTPTSHITNFHNRLDSFLKNITKEE